MADDNKYRSTRSSDPYRSAADPSRSIDFGADSDPLAELARLIGQSDSFGEYGRASPRASQSRDLPPRDMPLRDSPSRDLSPRELLSRELSQRDLSSRYASPDLPPRGYSAPQAIPEWPPSLGSSSDRRYEADPRGPGRESYPAIGDYPPARAPARDPLPPGDGYPAPRGLGREAFASQPAPDDLAARPAPPLPQEEPRRSQREEPRRTEPQSGDLPAASAPADEAYAEDRAPATASDGSEDYYQDDAALQPEDEEIYDDAPGSFRRSGIVTALVLILCALLGTAGAYAYRSYAHPNGKEPPPVITADNSTPAKVVPPSAEARSGKQISDRFATASTGEQLVSRQEEPVALREPGTATAPRVVLPAPVQPAPPPPMQAMAPPMPAPPATTAPATTATTPGSEPKRVRTVTIRPDGSEETRPVTPPAPRAPTGTTPPAPRAAAPARDGGPLSLQPNEPRARGSNAPPPTSLSAYSPSGGYVVQLSSQKTENEAHSAFRALQAKFPNELGSRQVIIRRADLGAKGVVYRTNVGPFPTAQEAQRFCSSYKSAGGQCIVPTN